MNELVHADIFFLVTTAVLIVLAIIFAIGLAYAVSILRDVKYMSKRIREEGDEVIEDIHILREHIKNEGFKLSMIARLVSKFWRRSRKGKRSRDDE